MEDQAYNDGYTQTMMQAKLFGIEYAQTCYHEDYPNVYKRYYSTGNSIECGRQWADGGLSALLEFHNQQITACFAMRSRAR